MQRLRAGEQELEYVWHGPPVDKKPTLVFLHEGLGCVAMWGDFPERLAQTSGCGAFVYSRAGYGGSDRIDLPRSINFMHEEALVVLPEILDRMEIRDAILIGHSDGASIALIHAGSKEGGRVRGLVLEAPHVFVEEISLRSIAAAAARFRDGSLRQGLERYHGDNVEHAFWGWNDVWLSPQFRSWNIEEYLPHIKAPVLAIQGVDDEYGSERQIEIIKQKCQGTVHTLMLPDCGHNPHRTRPHPTLEAIAAFLASEALGSKY